MFRITGWEKVKHKKERRMRRRKSDENPQAKRDHLNWQLASTTDWSQYWNSAASLLIPPFSGPSSRWGRTSAQEAIRSSRTGIKGGCKPPCGCWGPNPGPLHWAISQAADRLLSNMSVVNVYTQIVVFMHPEPRFPYIHNDRQLLPGSEQEHAA